MHFREVPFLRLFAPLCAGVILAEAVPSASTAAWAVTFAATAVMVVRVFGKGYRPDKIFGTTLFFMLLSTGYLLNISAEKHLTNLEPVKQVFTLRLSEYPEKKSASCSFRAKIISASADGREYTPHGSLMLYFISDTIPSRWQPGDRLMLRITPRPVENNGNPCEFDYRRYLEGQGIKYFGILRAADIIEYKPATHRSIREWSLIVAHGMTRIFEEVGLHGEELGLVMALTIGDKDLIDRKQLTSFSRSGAMHIMAVSGLHVGMISLGLSFLLFFMRGRLRTAKALIIITALWGFAFITGMSPSVLRATIMFSFLQAGNLLHRPAPAMNSLLASAFILTALRPAVIFEAGFQLSYLAVAFILLFYEPLYMMIRFKNKIPDYLWQMIVVSLVAQAGTLALSVRLFNIFPLLFLATNLVVIPISFVVLILAFLLIVFSGVTPVAGLLGMILEKLSGFTLSFTGAISSLDHGVIENIGFSSPEVLMLTAAIALLFTSLLRVGKITLKSFLVAASLFLMCTIIRNGTENRRDRIIVYHIWSKELRVRQDGRILTVPSIDGQVPPEVRKHAATRGLKIKVVQTV